MTATLFTIGHSNHPIEHVIGLLLCHGVTALADVRSAPFSRFTPQFNQEQLRSALRGAGLHYVFLGRELGARSTDPSHYRDGKAQYDLMAQSPEFQRGLDRLRIGIQTQRIALMCAEKDPLECHRTMLVGVRMRSPEIALVHILATGELETHEAAEQRLLARHQLAEPELFRSADERLAEAYRRQCDLIQYEDAQMANEQHGAHA